ncbi:hypothetical protein TWF506_010666 [Arthrobotrys conoides]|uniref:Uncharacterized protein n=1 Tax=Arthrobotrys conoides TaxID=74498 RepID=A0AAN8NHW8_9PEZI
MELTIPDHSFKIEAAQQIVGDMGGLQQQEPWSGDSGQYYPSAIDNSATRDVFDEGRPAWPNTEEKLESSVLGVRGDWGEDSAKVELPEGRIEVEKTGDGARSYVPSWADDYNEIPISKVEDVGRRGAGPDWEIWNGEIIEQAEEPIPFEP